MNSEYERGVRAAAGKIAFFPTVSETDWAKYNAVLSLLDDVPPPDRYLMDVRIPDHAAFAARGRWKEAYEALLDNAPAPDGVTVQEAAKMLLRPDEKGFRNEVYAACSNRVKVYKFDAVLRALSGDRT